MDLQNSSTDKFYQSKNPQVEDHMLRKSSFQNESPFEEGTKTITNITVTLKYYVNEKRFYYYVDYEYTNFKESKEYKELNDTDLLHSHPFYGFSEDRISSSKNGVIVVKNSMTETMINYLLMKDQELANHIGRAIPSAYKVNIIRSLDNLWD